MFLTILDDLGAVNRVARTKRSARECFHKSLQGRVKERSLQGLARVHPPPSPQKVREEGLSLRLFEGKVRMNTG